MFAACTNDTTMDLAPQCPLPERVYASLDTDVEADDESRVFLNEHLKHVWDVGDYIFVSMKGSGTFYAYTGTTASQYGEFVKVEGETPVPMPQFDRPIAMYSSSIGMAQFSDGSPAPMVTIPAIQRYTPNSYDKAAALPMIGLAESNASLNFAMKPTCAMLCLNLIGSKAVSSITLKSKNNNIAGRLFMNVADSPNPNNAGLYDNLSNTIEMQMATPVQLSKSPTKFYFVIFHTTYASGDLTMTVKFSDGTVFSKVNTLPFELYANYLQPFKSVDTDEVSGPSVPKIGLFSITYNTPEAYLPYFLGSGAASGTIDLGDGYGCQLNAYSYYEFADTKASHTVICNTDNANIVGLENCHGVTHVDFSQF